MEATITLNEIQSQWTEDALNFSDAQCTRMMMNDEYVHRQALFICETCPSSRIRLLCSPCAGYCHEGHTLRALYSKRNTRCDCSSEKGSCLFQPEVHLAWSERNPCFDATRPDYENFSTGRYCRCKQTYSDDIVQKEDDSAEKQESNADGLSAGDMLQCLVCEDWFHFDCLNAVAPCADDFEHFICCDCIEKRVPWIPLLENDENEVKCPIEKLRQLAEPICAPKDYFFKNEWRSRICRCAECMEWFKSQNAMDIVDPNDDPVYLDQENDEVAELMQADTVQIIQRAFPECANDATKTIIATEAFCTLRDALSKLCKSKESDVVTADDITEMFQKIKRRRERDEEKRDHIRQRFGDL